MYCKHCGKELSDEAIMCPDCGTPTGIKPVKKATDSPDSATNGNAATFAIAGFILSVIAFVFGVILLSLGLAIEVYYNNNILIIFSAIIGLTLSICGLIKNNSQKNATIRGLAIAGIVLSSVIMFYDFIVICLQFSELLNQAS